MAHQTQNIPWDLLADAFEWHDANKCKKDAADYHWGKSPNRGENLNQFVKVLAKAIHEHSDLERKKYPAEYDKPDAEDVVVSDDICYKIIPTVRRWRSQLTEPYPFDADSPVVLCSHEYAESSKESCECALPLKERKMQAFQRPRRDNGCYDFFEQNHGSFFNLEVFKTLLLCGEVDMLLKIYSHSGHHLAEWWQAAPCECVGGGDGWGRIAAHAVNAYLLLNFIYATLKGQRGGARSDRDYRDSRLYQLGLFEITMSNDDCDIPKYAHRRFFGIEEDQFNDTWENIPANKETLKKMYEGSYPCGRLPWREFLVFQSDPAYMPSASDVHKVHDILYSMALPSEIVRMIMSFANYGETTRQLPVEHDPLHPDNHEELGKYLDHCWNLLIWCDIIAKTIGMDLDWGVEISNAILSMGRCHCSRVRGQSEQYFTFDHDGKVCFV